MKTTTREQILNCSDFNQLLNAEYGERGTQTREQFEAEAEAFVLGEILRQERKSAGLTQQQLAEQSGYNKTTISRLEKGSSKVSLSSIFHIFAGMGRKVAISVLSLTLLLTLGVGQMWGAAKQRYIYCGISDNFDTYKDGSNWGFNFWGGTSEGVKTPTYIANWDHDGRTYHVYRVQVHDDNNKAQFKGNKDWWVPGDGYSVTLNGTTNNAVFFSSSSDGWDGQFQENYQVTSTASLSATSTSMAIGSTSTLTPSLSSNADYNEIKSTTYTVSTNPNSGGSVTSAGVFSATKAGTYTVTATVTYNAKDFSGITKTATATKNITVYATVTFDKEGGSSGTNSQNATYNATTSNIIAPSKDYHDFGGYWTGDDGTGTMVINASGVWQKNISNFTDNSSTPKWIILTNQTLHAKWTPKNYSITYKDQGNVAYSGSNEASLPSSYTYGTGIASLTDGVKSGYRFDGWFTESTCSGDPVTSISSSANGDKTFYAKWTENPGGTVTLTAGTGGQVSKDNSSWGTSKSYTGIKTTDALNIYAQASAGYTFSSWSRTSGTGTIANTSSASTTYTPVANADAELTANFTENKVTLTPTVSYDHGTSSYTASSSNTVGVTTTTNLTCSAPTAAHYTFAGWTLTNLTVTSGNAATDRNITVKINDPNGATPAAVANYNEVLTTAWTLKGSFVDDFATTYYFEKKSGESTTSIGYCTLTLDAGETYSFKVIKDGSTWYGNSGTMTYDNCTNWTFTTAESSNAGITTTSAGTYQFKIDFSGANPVVSVIYPPTLTFSATSVYSGNASTLTASVSNVVSGKTIKYDVYAGATATGVAVATWSGSTSSTTHSHAFSNITPSFGANDISKQYTVKVTYDGSRIATYTGYIGRKWDIYVHDVQSWGMMKVHMWNAAGPKSTYPGDPCSLYNGSTSWYTVTLDGLYNGGFVLSANGDATKTSDQTMSISSFGAGTYWYVTAYKTGSLNSVSVSDPTVTLSATVTNTNQINLTGNVSNFGGDGTAASDMKEVYFKVNNVKDASSITASTTDGNFTKTLNNPTPDNTNNNLQAFAENIHGTGSSSILKFTRVTLDNQSATSAGTANVLAVNGAAMASGASAPAKTGYAFGGYYQSTGGADKQYYNASMGSANNWDQTTATKTIYAKWTPITYYVSFSANGGSGDAMSNQSFTYDEADDLTANTYTRTGYTFDGWATSAGGTKVYDDEDEVINLSSTANAVVPLFAHWDANDYTVTLDIDEAHKGTIDGKTTSQSVTYDAVTTTVPLLPTAENGYGLEGYYTEQNGAGTKVIDYDGKWIASIDGYTDADKKWVHDGNVTLYAYYKKAEITALTFDAGTVEPGATVGVTPTISPTPVAPTIICWTILHSNDTPLDPQPAKTWSDGKLTFAASDYSGTYKVQAVLRTGDACGAGDPLDTETASFLVAGSHSVTVNYKCSGDVIKTATSVTGRPTVWSDDITAPDIFGYTFSSWSSADGVTIKDSENEDVTSSTDATIRIKAIYAGSLTANYTQNQMIFFKNTLGWENVYVNFYTASDWDNTDNGSGSPKGAGNKNVTNRNKTMTQYGETDIWYYDYEYNGGGSSITPSLYVSFTDQSQNNVDEFWASNPGINVVYPANYADAISTDKSSENGFKAATPMFVPIAAQDPVLVNVGGGGRANYYNAGYWSKYTPGTGYVLEVYNSAGDEKLKTIEFESADDLMPMKSVAQLEGGQTYKFQIRRGGESSAGVYYGNKGTMTYTNHGQDVAWDLTNTMSPKFSMAGITTNAAGDYKFNLSYSPYHNESTDVDEYRLRIAVDYPVADGDYRLVYSDAVQTKPLTSAIVNKVNDGTDIVSFFVRPGSTPVLRFQQATVNPSTGAVTWNEYPNSGTPTNQITGTIATALSSGGTDVYNFNLSMNGSGALSVASVAKYDGNYYIRTDAANSKWDNYRTDPDHRMTYSEYSITHGGYTHYYTHWVDKDVTGRKNVKFVIANDYSPNISDTLARETATGTWANIDKFIEEGGDLKRSANVRFMWDKRDNTISRAYVDGAQGDYSANFLYMLNVEDGADKIKKGDGTALTDHKVTFKDNGNWMYEANIKAQPTAQIRLLSNWGTENTITQYFRGASDATETLLGGSGSTWYDIRIIYDFKSNRLIAGLIPSGTIDEQMAIHADVMFIREHHGDIAQLTFAKADEESPMGAITDIQTAFGVLQFNKWTINNKSKETGHAPLSPLLSQFERDLFYVSFPFKVAMEEVFGFGTYGQHWIIEEYDGASRATNGYWQESGPNWKFVFNRKNKYFEPGQGYIIALDLDELGESSDIWANTDQVELYFPSYGKMDNITSSTATYTIPSHLCTINRSNESNGHGGTLGPQYDRRVKDSHWNVLGVPTYVNPDAPNFANTDWTTEATETSIGPNFLYQWSMTDNTVSPVSASGYTYHAMHAYLVQYCGNVTWTSSVSVTPSSIVARRTYDEAPRSVEFRLELTQNDVAVDQTFVKLSDNEAVTTGFEFNYDLSKEFNKNRANIYTLIGTEQVAGNVLPLTDQTTVVPVGVSIPTAGDYTFSLPDGTEGIGVTLIDNQTGTRTRLSALDYTVNLTTGTHDGRFILEISPIHNATTEVELINGANGANDEIGARKVLIDGILYIVKGDKLYDVRGTMIK